MKKLIFLLITVFLAISLVGNAQNSGNQSDKSVNLQNQKMIKSEINKNVKKIQLPERGKTMHSAQKGKTYKNVGILKTAPLEISNLKAKASSKAIRQSFENVKLRIDNMQTKERAEYKLMLLKKREAAIADGVKGKQFEELRNIINYVNEIN